MTFLYWLITNSLHVVQKSLLHPNLPLTTNSLVDKATDSYARGPEFESSAERSLPAMSKTDHTFSKAKVNFIGMEINFLFNVLGKNPSSVFKGTYKVIIMNCLAPLKFLLYILSIL